MIWFQFERDHNEMMREIQMNETHQRPNEIQQSHSTTTNIDGD